MTSMPTSLMNQNDSCVVEGGIRIRSRRVCAPPRDLRRIVLLRDSEVNKKRKCYSRGFYFRPSRECRLVLEYIDLLDWGLRNLSLVVFPVHGSWFLVLVSLVGIPTFLGISRNLDRASNSIAIYISTKTHFFRHCILQVG